MNVGALLQLSRWREHVPYVVPLTLIGALTAARATGSAPGSELVAILIANVLANCLAFMVNDIEDAGDDTHDPERARRNAVASGALSPAAAWTASLACGAAGLVFYVLGDGPDHGVLACGTAILALAVLYSWRRVRLKGLPGIDVLSHGLMLGGLLLLAAYLAAAPGHGGWVLPVTAVTLISAYGQFHNQLRDLEADRAAGLRNTAICVGRRATWMLLYGCLAAAALCIVTIVVLGIIPLWTFAVAGVAALASWRLRERADMRGATPLDPAAKAQRPMLDGLNAMAFSWLAQVLLAS